MDRPGVAGGDVVEGSRRVTVKLWLTPAVVEAARPLIVRLAAGPAISWRVALLVAASSVAVIVSSPAVVLAVRVAL